MMYNDKIKLLYMNTDSFVLLIETEDFFENIKNDINNWYDTSKYLKSLNLPLEYGVNKMIIGKMENQLFDDGFMKEFNAIGPKVYGFTQFKYDGTMNKTREAEGTNKCVADKTLNFDNLKRCLFNNETSRCIQHKFKSKPGLINTIEINKIKDNKRLRTFDGITTYPIGTSAFKVSKSEMETTIKNRHKVKESLLICDREKYNELNSIPIALYC